jgi:hypothetical protein
MTLRFSQAKFVLTLSPGELVQVNRPNSMLLRLFHDDPVASAWQWELGGKAPKLHLSLQQARRLIDFGRAGLPLERQMLGLIYDAMLTEDLVEYSLHKNFHRSP